MVKIEIKVEEDYSDFNTYVLQQIYELLQQLNYAFSLEVHDVQSIAIWEHNTNI
jgi:hypothetical protein